jgi:hypothetical protein
MKPETLDYFLKAKKKLENAKKLMDIGLYEDAARNSYLAGMNAARALLFEDGFRVLKQHKTLYGALSKVLHDRGIHDHDLSAFLPTVMKLKAIADYEEGEDTITEERASKAIEDAKHFVSAIKKIASTPAKAPQNGKHKKPTATT